MGFPVTILGVTYNLADFSGMGYLSAFSDIITRLEECSVSNLPSGPSTTSLTVSVATKTLTVPVDSLFEPGNFVAIHYDPTNYMYGVVSTYTASTGVLVVEVKVAVGAGTYASWKVSQAPYLRLAPVVPIGVMDGGTGEQTFGVASLTIDRKLLYQSGFHFINLDASDNLLPPNYYETSDGVAASGNSKLKGNANITKDTQRLSAGAYAEVKDVGDETFWSVGKVGYLSLQNTGDLLTAIKFSGDSPTTAENYKLRFGLVTNNAPNLSNHENYGALGVEISYGDVSVTIRYFCSLPGVVKELVSIYSMPAIGASEVEIGIRYNHLNEELTIGYTPYGEAAFTVDLSPFIAKLATLGAGFRASNLLRPFLYMTKTSGTAVKAVVFETMQVKQYLRRA